MVEINGSFFLQHHNFPVNTEDINGRVNENNVVLEYFFIRGPIGYGAVRVKDRAYSKRIFVRFTIDKWKSHNELDATHSLHFSETNTDRFQFKLQPNVSDLSSANYLTFVIGYCVNEETFWDNNFTHDYNLEIVHKNPKQTPNHQILSVYNPTPKTSENADIPVGLRNSSESCYMNAVLQCLFNTSILNDKFFQNYVKYAWKRPVTNEYIHLLKLLIAGDYSSFDPFAFKQVFGHIKLDYLSGSQQDAHEFLTDLIQCFDQESKFEENYSSLFEGLLSTETKCTKCSYVVTNTEPFFILSIAIPRDSYSTLNSCIGQMMLEEHVGPEVGWNCSSCHTYCLLTRKTSIRVYPRILIVHLKRFLIDTDGRMKKNFVMIYYPMKISFSTSNIEVKYELYAVVNHQGSIHDGHYTSFCRSSSSSDWWCFDDEKVQRLSNDEIVSNSHAYLLFYEMKQS